MSMLTRTPSALVRIFGVCILAGLGGACGSGSLNADGGAHGGGGGGSGGSSGGSGGGPTVDGGTCNTQPCGGDIVGTWLAGSFCVNEPAYSDRFNAGAPENCQLRYASAIVSGTLVFAAAGTYTSSLVMDETRTYARTPECLQGLSCDQETARLSQNITGTVMGLQSVSCAAVTSGGCTCTLVFRSPFAPESSGTFTTSGNQLTVMGTNGSQSSSRQYCVQGSTLHFVTPDYADLTLTKQ